MSKNVVPFLVGGLTVAGVIGLVVLIKNQRKVPLLRFHSPVYVDPVSVAPSLEREPERPARTRLALELADRAVLPPQKNNIY